MSLERLNDKRDGIRQQVEAMFRSQAPVELPVSVVMTVAPRCVRPDASVLEMVKLLHTHGFRHLLVTDEAENLLGVVSDRDLVRCFGPNEYPDQAALRRITAAEIMSTELVTIEPHAPLVAAIDRVLTHGVNCLPVVAQRRLLGILTTTDLYATLQEVLESLRRIQTESALSAAPCGE